MNPRYLSEILITEGLGSIANISGNRYNVDAYDADTN